MNDFYYDFHIHSCLSPCASNDMTPNDILGVCKLAGLSVVALTDHNSTLNCPAFFKAASKYGITPIAGMELTTSEDIHAVCLFETLEAAMDFNSFVHDRRNLIPNRTDIFGDQLILNELDQLVSTETNFLPNATNLDLNQAYNTAVQFDGICYPAHIERESNGLLSILGDFPNDPDFKNVEVHNWNIIEELKEKYSKLQNKKIMYGSDAHYLWSVNDKMATLKINAKNTASSEEIRREIFSLLRGEVV